MLPEQTDALAGVIDVNELLTRCLGNVEFAGRILAMFQDRCAADVAEIERALDIEDAESVARVAHRLKGACANAAALGMKTKASRLEQAARELPLPEIAEQFQELRAEWLRFKEALAPLDIAAGASAPS
jgi:HPt (histidine-containing phosphotransfer) domain-containing protein